MAAVVTPLGVAVLPENPMPGPGDLRTSFANVAADSSYPTGGYTLDPKQFGFAQQIVFVIPQMATTGLRDYVWNSATNKLMAFTSSTGAQVANATDISADAAVPCVAFGY